MKQEDIKDKRHKTKNFTDNIKNNLIQNTTQKKFWKNANT